MPYMLVSNCGRIFIDFFFYAEANVPDQIQKFHIKVKIYMRKN